ncbi:MAG TPA: PQQ-binding-like beta-propeller repeat protein [Verrucomicrobiota bacterium]|nr:PQQ-binding-like beta-propeller repeat protein [Verrucomicrobiota bacterium]HOH41127.1 PQQ-binding-like beta-propeller repeat protein [Verrucomicrobiota bacterium]
MRTTMWFARLSIGLAWLLAGAAAPAASRLTNDWSVPFNSISDSAPAIGPDGTIYVGTWKGRLWALNPEGARKWTFAAGNEIKSAPAVGADGTIYFGSRDRKLYAVHPRGQKRWEFLTGGWVDSSPALGHDGTVCFGSWDGNFYALNTNGVKQWVFPTGGAIVSSPAIGADGAIYFGSHDRKFYALAADGRKKWEFATGDAIISSPALNGDQGLYFTSVDGWLYALTLEGRLRWRLRTGGITESSPVIGPDGTIYLGVFAHFWAVSPEGKKRWQRFGDPLYPFESTPFVLEGGIVGCVSRSGLLCYLTPKGEVEGKYGLSGYGYSSPTVGPTGQIYTPDNRVPYGGFSALRAGVALARTPWPKFRGNIRNTGNILDGNLYTPDAPHPQPAPAP